jgi:tetratricopeptide (TPR) repeat protein
MPRNASPRSIRVLELSDVPSTRLYALMGRAGARRVLHRETEARADYQSVLEQLGPDDPWLEGWVRYNLADYGAAVNAYQRALADDPSRISAQFDLALVLAVAGKPEALALYRATLTSLDAREPRGRLTPLRGKTWLSPASCTRVWQRIKPTARSSTR